MERRSFLKSLGILAGTALIPNGTEKLCSVIDKKTRKPYELIGVSDECKKQWTNNMTIQRKIIRVTGSARQDIIWYNDGAMAGYFEKK